MAVRPAGLVAVNAKVPMKPFDATMVIVEVLVWPGARVMPVGLAVMPKHEEAVTTTETTVE